LPEAPVTIAVFIYADFVSSYRKENSSAFSEGSSYL